MATPPVFTLTDTNNNTVPVLNFGVVDAGNQTGGVPIRIWNNQNNAANVADGSNTTLTTKTLNGYDQGDSVENGQEIVTFTMINVQCRSTGETAYSPIGGAQVHPVGYAPIVNGAQTSVPSGAFSEMLLSANIPQNATAASITFLIRISYQYS